MGLFWVFLDPLRNLRASTILSKFGHAWICLTTSNWQYILFSVAVFLDICFHTFIGCHLTHVTKKVKPKLKHLENQKYESGILKLYLKIFGRSW